MIMESMESRDEEKEEKGDGKKKGTHLFSEEKGDAFIF